MEVVRWLSAGAMMGFSVAVWLDRFVDLQQYAPPVAILMALCMVALVPNKRERSA